MRIIKETGKTKFDTFIETKETFNFTNKYGVEYQVSYNKKKKEYRIDKRIGSAYCASTSDIEKLYEGIRGLN